MRQLAYGPEPIEDEEEDIVAWLGRSAPPAAGEAVQLEMHRLWGNVLLGTERADDGELRGDDTPAAPRARLEPGGWVVITPAGADGFVEVGVKRERLGDTRRAMRTAEGLRIRLDPGTRVVVVHGPVRLLFRLATPERRGPVQGLTAADLPLVGLIAALGAAAVLAATAWSALVAPVAPDGAASPPAEARFIASPASPAGSRR